MTQQMISDSAAAMDDMAAWAQSNVVSLPRPGGNAAAVKGATAMLESSARALQAAMAMHLAARIERDVGRFGGGLEYTSVYFRDIREFVTLGINYSPFEPGDSEKPAIGETLEISEVWLRGVDIGILLQDAHTDELMTALQALRKQGGAQ